MTPSIYLALNGEITHLLNDPSGGDSAERRQLEELCGVSGAAVSDIHVQELLPLYVSSSICVKYTCVRIIPSMHLLVCCTLHHDDDVSRLSGLDKQIAPNSRVTFDLSSEVKKGVCVCVRCHIFHADVQTRGT